MHVRRGGEGRDHLILVEDRYSAYMVVGKLVALCERELPVCEALVEEVP